MSAGAVLYAVHAVDTEGRLYESPDATFERLEAIVGIRLEPTEATLQQIRRGEVDVGGHEDVAKLVVSEQLLTYNETWDRLDTMLDELSSADFRQRHADSLGRPWVFSWFVMDHVGYAENPRRRDVGWHNVYDHYRRRQREAGSEIDELHWHFHPASTYGEAHVNATSYLRSPHLLEPLARRVLDRHDFPVCYRPGFHVERPDSHWFLEQWIPFDYGNQAVPGVGDDEGQRDLAGGRFGDWRRAPHDWSPYHPSHDDYQRPGACRRVIFRCLNVGTRLRLLDEQEVERAFRRTASGEPTVLAVTDHDFRDMRPDVRATHALSERVAQRYPAVVWRNAGAARAVLGFEPEPELRFEVDVEREPDAVRLHARSSHDTLGPQPFLAVRTLDRHYLTDNFDIHEPPRSWSYVFDAQSIRPESVDSVGVASADRAGAHAITVLDREWRPRRVGARHP